MGVRGMHTWMCAAMLAVVLPGAGCYASHPRHAVDGGTGSREDAPADASVVTGEVGDATDDAGDPCRRIGDPFERCCIRPSPEDERLCFECRIACL